MVVIGTDVLSISSHRKQIALGGMKKSTTIGDVIDARPLLYADAVGRLFGFGSTSFMLKALR
jgi:hypothetical protein